MNATFDHRGEFDELFIDGADVHVERMSATSFWVGIRSKTEDIHINTGVHRGQWYFNVEDMKGKEYHSVSRPRGLTKRTPQEVRG